MPRRQACLRLWSRACLILMEASRRLQILRGPLSFDKTAVHFCRAGYSASLFLALLAKATLAREDATTLCLHAASEAAAKTGVPYDVLLAISTVETGRNNRPWPWTVNFGGTGTWFDTAAEAEASVAEALNQGATNVDLGCFQLNYRWHAQGFASIADMLDPEQNATYAARFLADHFAQTGDWALAAAAYHSATPEYAAAYQAKFEAAYAGFEGSADFASASSPLEGDRLNRFPLLVAGATGTRGSLVPTGSGGIPLIGGP
jgi:Transglycosylase SLT domain